jgi:hypothetical protein
MANANTPDTTAAPAPAHGCPFCGETEEASCLCFRPTFDPEV